MGTFRTTGLVSATSINTDLNEDIEERIPMSLNRQPAHTSNMAELLEKVLTGTGFSADQMEELLNCELNTDHLLEYITAVKSKRMN